MVDRTAGLEGMPLRRAWEADRRDNDDRLDESSDGTTKELSINDFEEPASPEPPTGMAEVEEGPSLPPTGEGTIVAGAEGRDFYSPQSSEENAGDPSGSHLPLDEQMLQLDEIDLAEVMAAWGSSTTGRILDATLLEER
jgi:hypothetical protein